MGVVVVGKAHQKANIGLHQVLIAGGQTLEVDELGVRPTSGHALGMGTGGGERRSFVAAHLRLATPTLGAFPSTRKLKYLCVASSSSFLFYVQ